MSKLYPPAIEGTIPAFTGTTLVVPFSLNKANSNSEITGMALKIKNIATNTLIANIKTTEFDLNECTASFDLSSVELNQGQFYKIQIAFISTIVGYYSTLGIVKYTSLPVLTIGGLKKNEINFHTYSYIVNYNQMEYDLTEKLYSTRIKIYSPTQLIYDSEDKIHNTSSDTENYCAQEEFLVEEELQDDVIYTIQAFAKTINGMEISSPVYQIKNAVESEVDIDGHLAAILNYELGVIELYYDRSDKNPLSVLISRAKIPVNIYPTLESLEFKLQHKESQLIQAKKVLDTLTPKMVTYYIQKTEVEALENEAAALKNEYKELIDSNLFWTKLKTIEIDNCFIDKTCEQGFYYMYSVQTYFNGVYSKKLMSDIILSDFEDIFLSDKDKTFKVKFNPKISSFKTTMQEQKTEMMGSKYPFILKNGNICYHEFPISGLISYIGDDLENFMDKKDLGIAFNSVNLTTENILAERTFREHVLAWLNNGQPKLFKSSTEGIFIVRLMNISLTPTDTLGRMIYSFSATAYEVAEANIINFNKYEFL